MRTPPPEFAVAGLEPSVQLYQLTVQVKRLRGTIQRMWVWIGVLTVVSGFAAAYDHWIPAQEVVARTLALDGVLLRAQGDGITVERDGKVLWRSP